MVKFKQQSWIRTDFRSKSLFNKLNILVFVIFKFLPVARLKIIEKLSFYFQKITSRGSSDKHIFWFRFFGSDTVKIPFQVFIQLFQVLGLIFTTRKFFFLKLITFICIQDINNGAMFWFLEKGVFLWKFTNITNYGTTLARRLVA